MNVLKKAERFLALVDADGPTPASLSEATELIKDIMAARLGEGEPRSQAQTLVIRLSLLKSRAGQPPSPATRHEPDTNSDEG